MMVPHILSLIIQLGKINMYQNVMDTILGLLSQLNRLLHIIVNDDT